MKAYKVRQIMYWCWRDMMLRCTSKRYKKFKNYGGRGIRVCERWQTFKNFDDDMRPLWPGKGFQIDRIDNNGNYEPSNCKWSTKSEQMSNTRRAHLITYKGETLCRTAWDRKLGLRVI